MTGWERSITHLASQAIEWRRQARHEGDEHAERDAQAVLSHLTSAARAERSLRERRERRRAREGAA